MCLKSRLRRSGSGVGMGCSKRRCNMQWPVHLDSFWDGVIFATRKGCEHARNEVYACWDSIGQGLNALQKGGVSAALGNQGANG